MRTVFVAVLATVLVAVAGVGPARACSMMLSENRQILWAPDGSALYFDHRDAPWRWTPGGEPVRLVEDRAAPGVGAMTLDPTGRWLAWSSVEAYDAACRGRKPYVKVVDAGSGEEVSFAPRRRRGYLTPPVWSPAGDRFLIAHARQARLGCSSETKLTTWLHDASFERVREVEALADPTARWHWAPDGTGLVLVTWEGLLRLETTGWTVAAEHAERYLDAPHAAFSRNGSRFAYASSRYQGAGRKNRNLLVILDGESLAVVREVDLGQTWPNGLAWTPDGARIVLHRDVARHASEPPSPELFAIDVATGQTVATHPVSRRGYGPVALAWSPDGTTLAVGGSRDRTDESPYLPLLVDADELSSARRADVAPTVRRRSSEVREGQGVAHQAGELGEGAAA